MFVFQDSLSKVYPSCPTYRASGDTPFFFLSPSPSNIFPKNLASFRRKAYLCRRKAALGNLKVNFHCARWHNLCSAVPVRPSPRLFDAGDDPGFFVFAKVHKYFDSDNKKAFFFSFFCYFLHPQTYFNNLVHLSEEKRIFAEAKLHSAICKQAFIAFAGIIFAARKLNH